MIPPPAFVAASGARDSEAATFPLEIVPPLYVFSAVLRPTSLRGSIPGVAEAISRSEIAEPVPSPRDCFGPSGLAMTALNRYPPLAGRKQVVG